MYAVIETGGKQYKVAPGQTLDVELLAAPKDNTVELDRVLLIADGDDVTVGNPTIEGAKVTATHLGDKKGEKVIVFKYKNKTRYSRKQGHRQLHTKLEIKGILKPGEEAAKPKQPRKRKATAGGEA